MLALNNMCKGKVVWKLWMNRLDRRDCCVYHTLTSQKCAFASACGGTITCSSCLDLTLYAKDAVLKAVLLLSRYMPASMHSSKSTVVLLSTIHGLFV